MSSHNTVSTDKLFTWPVTSDKITRSLLKMRTYQAGVKEHSVVSVSHVKYGISFDLCDKPGLFKEVPGDQVGPSHFTQQVHH